ncbi:alpha/beta hydrolase [Nocardia iowensis]|uniref:alpha/beta hydrolase n=1 Tax=Nocardia iowensis TaxID=204891 RepID=UPI001FE39FFA|nr:alpha/beta hydrolase [Nocardia iowensis]
MVSELHVVFGPDVVTHWRTAAELLAEAFAVHEVSGEVVLTGDAAEFAAAVRAAGPDDEFIVVPGSAALPDDAAGRVVRVDFGRCELDRSACVRVHIRGRGLEGLRYAVASWYFHRFHPPTVVGYGPHPYQRVDMRIPSGPGPFPVAVLIHGGYWKPWWDFDLMDAMAVDLTSRGYATWNVEYRRPAESDWAATTEDVATAFAAIATAPEASRLDLDRIVVLGHSAGGQLAFRLAADTAPASLRPALVVSLAGVLDLRAADHRHLGDGAVAAALGQRYSPESEVYRQASPIARLPIGVPQLVVCGLHDEPDMLEMSRHYTDRAAAANDRVTMLEAPGEHFAVIDPGSEIWRQIVQWLANNR